MILEYQNFLREKFMLRDYSILISGGFGHIGWQLAKVLSENNSIYLFENNLMNRPRPIEDISITETIFDDVKNVNHYNIKCDLFFHFGEYSRVEQSFKDVKKTLTYNFGPMRNILEFCKYHDSKLVYSGSSTKLVIMAKTVMRRHTLGPRPRIRN